MDKTPMQVLIDSRSEVNAIHPSFATQLGLPIRPIDMREQKNDDIIQDTHRRVVAIFSMVNKVSRVRFFEKIFLVANVSLNVVFGIFFLTLSGVDVDFSGRELWWKTYITKEAFQILNASS